MAALLVKSLWPSSTTNGHGRYNALPASSPLSSDVESGSSAESGDEKAEATAYERKGRFLSTPINPRIISDATIGLSDGLTVPFALTAGLSALGDTKVVIYGGFAELIAGGISMGLGGYLGAKSEAEAYQAALSETKAIVANNHQKASDMVYSTFAKYDFSDTALQDMSATLLASPHQMVDFLMHFHHQLAEADFAPSKAYLSGLTIALGYIVGGLVALFPYLFVSSVQSGFYGSVLVMALALFAFGWTKTSLVGENNRWVCLKNGVQMLVLGGVAAGAAMCCVKAIGS